MIVKRVSEGFMLPRGYGVAWVDYMRNQAVCLPIPFNVLAGVIRNIWFWMLFGYRGQFKSDWDAWAQGFAAGIKKAKETENG